MRSLREGVKSGGAETEMGTLGHSCSRTMEGRARDRVGREIGRSRESILRGKCSVT